MQLNLNFWGAIFYLVLIVFGILIAGLSIQIASDLIPPENTSIGVMEFVTQSIVNPPIQELLFTQAAVCPTGYQNITLGTWPGNKMGCYFGRGSVGESCIEPNIPSKDPRDILKWGASIVCVQRNTRFELGPSITCKKDFRKCSKDLCVSIKEKCPITGIQMFNRDELGKNETDCVTMEDGARVLKLYRILNEQPVFNIETSVIGRPCYSRGSVPFKEGPYPLLRVKFGCGEYEQDNSTYILDFMKEVDLYKLNDLDDVLTDLLGYQDTIRAEMVYLVARKKPELRQLPACYESRPEATEISKLPLFETWGEWIFTIALMELLTAVPLIMFLYRDINRRGMLKRLSIANKLSIFNPVYYGIIVFYVAIYTVLKGIKESSRDFLVLAARECFVEDNLSNAAINFAELVKDRFYPNYTKVCLIIWFGVARVMASIYMVFYILAEKKAGYNPHDPRNKSETETQWFAPKPDPEQDKHYLSI